jgi:DUF2934 family protein
MLTIKRRPIQPAEPISAPKPPAPERRAETAKVTNEQIGSLAYKRWQQAGCPVSDGVEFWLAAEAELRGSRRR